MAQSAMPPTGGGSTGTISEVDRQLIVREVLESSIPNGDNIAYGTTEETVVATNSRYYTEIAEAIRSKNKDTAAYYPADMPNEILKIVTGGASLQISTEVNVDVSITNNTTLYTKTSNNNGIVVFDGLTSGVWNIVISNGTQTSDPVPISIVSEYTTIVKFFRATINITYPEGTTCTCTKGDIKFTAPDTSGVATFIVPEIGDYTISCADGINEYSDKQIAITIDRQIENVVIYKNAYLFNVTPITDELTGGWDGVAIKRDSVVNATPMKPVVTQYQDHATLTYGSGGTTKSGMYKTVKKIDLTDVQSIEFTGILKTVSTTDIATRACLSCWSEIGSYWNLNVTARIGVEVGNGVYGTYSLDVSELSGSHYVGFNLHSTYSDISIYKLQLKY